MAKSYQKKQEWDATEHSLTLVHKTALRSRRFAYQFYDSRYFCSYCRVLLGLGRACQFALSYNLENSILKQLRR
jgi:hypothetical protein